MKRFFVLCTALCLGTAMMVGCENKTKVEKKETVSDPGGTTTKTDSTEVKSKGDNPPTTSTGEKVDGKDSTTTTTTTEETKTP